jgi:hypothetical protein
MRKEAKLQSQVANLQAQNARVVKELNEAKRTIKRSEDAVFKYEPLWIASEKHSEDLEAAIIELQKDKLHLEEIETDQSSTIGFIEQGIKQWKKQAEDAEAELARHEWVSVEDGPPKMAKGDLVCYSEMVELLCLNHDNEDDPDIGAGFYDHSRKRWTCTTLHPVTHWKSISLPATQEKEKK